MTRKIAMVILLAWLPAPATWSAQFAATQSTADARSRYIDPASGLTLADAIAQALRQEPGMRAARTDIDAAAGRRQQAALRANPTVTFERREEPGGTDHQSALGIELPLELFRRGARVAVAEREADVARLEVADRERQLAAEVRVRFGEALVAIRELAVFDELVTATQRQLDLLAARAREGAAPPLERDLLDVEVERLIAERRLQESRVEAAVVVAKRTIGLHPEVAVAFRDTLETFVTREVRLAARAEDAEQLVRARPDVRASEARMRAADAKIRQRASEGRIDLSVFGTYMRMDGGFPQAGFAPGGTLERVRGRFNYVAGGAMVMVPLFNRNQGAVAAAHAERLGAEAARDAAVLQARAELEAARVEHDSASASVAHYRDRIRPMARRNLDVVAETFTLGRATVFDVLAEQRRYLEIERAYTVALRSAFEARTRLQLAAGGMP